MAGQIFLYISIATAEKAQEVARLDSAFSMHAATFSLLSINMDLRYFNDVCNLRLPAACA